nr:pentatricopeptide repeat-containing protein At5g48910-like [Malus domestica]
MWVLDYAKRVFEGMPEKNAVVWNSLISGYSLNGSSKEAIDVFREMCCLDVKADTFTISGLLSACAQMGAVNIGNWVRKFAEKNGLWDVFIGTSLVDLYAKCGSIEAARDVFDQMDKKTVATWNAILSGYASNGQAGSAIELLDDMRKSGVMPDSATFLSILHACAHAGLVEKGRQYFDLMVKTYKIAPKVEHYGCMVDLLGRAGLLKEARKLIERMDIEPNVVVWGSLFNACSIHGDIEVGEWAADHVFNLEAMDGGSYVLLANMYAAARRFDRVKAVREAMVNASICKLPGCSMIEIGDVIHEFLVADKTHPESEEIYTVLDELSNKLKMTGSMQLPALDEECLESS